MEEKETYTLQELFELLPVSIVELARKTGINEVTIARIRDGKTARRDTANKLMIALSEAHKVPLSIRNVTGLNIQTPTPRLPRAVVEDDSTIEWTGAREATDILSFNAGRKITDTYLRLLAKAGKIRSKKKTGNQNVYAKSDVQSYKVGTRRESRGKGATK